MAIISMAQHWLLHRITFFVHVNMQVWQTAYFQTFLLLLLFLFIKIFDMRFENLCGKATQNLQTFFFFFWGGGRGAGGIYVKNKCLQILTITSMRIVHAPAGLTASFSLVGGNYFWLNKLWKKPHQYFHQTHAGKVVNKLSALEAKCQSQQFRQVNIHLDYTKALKGKRNTIKNPWCPQVIKIITSQKSRSTNIQPSHTRSVNALSTHIQNWKYNFPLSL